MPAESQASQTPQMTHVVYAVADLVIPFDCSACTPYKPLQEMLMTVITKTVDPASWSENGGAASIQYYPLGMALIVRQTRANQEQIVDVLTALRRLQEVEVAVEARLVWLPSETAEASSTLAGFHETISDEPRCSGNMAFLNDRQLRSWLTVFRCEQACKIMQPPKITLFNGQQGGIEVGDEISVPSCASDVEGNVVVGSDRLFNGLLAKFIPVVSADRRFVRLHMDWSVTTMNGSNSGQPEFQRLALDKVVVLPSNGTVVCSLGKTTADGREMCCPPRLSKIPYLNRLLSNALSVQEKREVFLLVTTRVITNTEN
jgi:Flp pilus assembly secretin CpaC